MTEAASGSSSYHLVGIGGIGMSAIARLLLARGETVTGSDEKPSRLVNDLLAEGASIAIGHRAEHVAGAGTMIVSSAIRGDNAELLEAQRLGIPIVRRGEMLARIIGDTPTIAVAGTHGKTTTTAMIALIFEAAGLDPTVAVGGQPVDWRSNARRGAGPWFITESDESDGSFLRLSPQIAVVTNIENDHIASDADMPRLIEQFATFIAKLPPAGCAIVGTDNVRSAQLVERRIDARVVTFAAGGPADITASDIRYDGACATFTLCERGSPSAHIALSVPGVINVQNALAAIAVARAARIGFATIAAALRGFHGVRRRFEVVGRCESLVVIDDYAHHPTAVAQTIAAARHVTDGTLIVAFQPHRYTRTAYLAADFARALGGADRVFLTPIYAAAEAPLPGVTEALIGEPLAAGGTPVTYADVDDLERAIRAAAPPRACILMLGAGSISAAAHRLGAAIESAALPVAAR